MGMVFVEASRETSDGVLRDGTILSTTKRSATHQRRVGVALWTVQGLLALLFLFAGGMKLAVPPEMLAAMTPLPVPFMRFIGLVEVLGGLGLVLPALTRIRPGLTPLAAGGLALEMIGATATTIAIGGGAAALMPFVVGLLAASVAHGRWRVARQTARSGRGRDLARTYLVAPGVR
jgi:uncharacterized membrane protein YphA (DoxX/SURF4 family)